MKKIVFFVVACLFIISCNKDNPRNQSVIIKGKVPAGSSAKSQSLKSLNSLSLDDAKKILVFNGLDNSGTLLNCKLVDIVDGSFTASAEMGNAAALVFLDGDNKYIGTLSTQGLNLLPLGKLTDGENTSIDLSILSLSGNNVLPSYNPFGNEIIISEEEIGILNELDGFFGSLAKNIDTDNDGILDLLDDRQIYIRSQFQLIAGRYGINNNPPVVSDTALNYINYSVFVFGGTGFTSPGNISLSGPLDSPYNDITRQFFSTDMYGAGFGSCFWREAWVGNVSPTGLGLLQFKSGTYTVTLDNKNYTLDYSTVDLKYNLLFVLPTLHTNAEGKLISVSLEYRLPDNTIIDNPENILSGVSIQLTGDNFVYDCRKMTNLPQDMLSDQGSSGLFSVSLDSPLDISRLHHIDLTYNDVLGNTYMLLYRNGQ